MGKFLLFNNQFTKAASMGSPIFTPSPDNFHLHMDSLKMKLLKKNRYMYLNFYTVNSLSYVSTKFRISAVLHLITRI